MAVRRAGIPAEAVSPVPALHHSEPFSNLFGVSKSAGAVAVELPRGLDLSKSLLK